MKWDALIRAYREYLATGRAENREAIEKEIEKLRELQEALSDDQ